MTSAPCHHRPAASGGFQRHVSPHPGDWRQSGFSSMASARLNPVAVPVPLATAARAVISFLRSHQTSSTCLPTVPRPSRTAALALASAPIHRSTKDVSRVPATCPCARAFACHTPLACPASPEFCLPRPRRRPQVPMSWTLRPAPKARNQRFGEGSRLHTGNVRSFDSAATFPIPEVTKGRQAVKRQPPPPAYPQPPPAVLSREVTRRT